LGGVLDSALFGVAQLLFDVAGLLWYALLWIIKLATELNMLKSAASVVDKIVGDVAQPIVGKGSVLLGIAITMIVVIAVWRGLHSGLHHAVRTGLKAIVPLVLLVFIATAAASDHGTGTVVMSPAWIANGVNSASNQISTIVVPSLQKTSLTQAPPSCAVYEAGLVSIFVAQENKISSANDETIPEVVNTLWEDSYLYSWGAAQFGDPATAERVDCRYLEGTDGVNPGTQEKIETAGIAASKSSSTYPTLPSLKKPLIYLAELLPGDSTTAAVTAFAACQYTNADGGGPSAATSWTVTAAGRLNTNNNDGPDYKTSKGATSQDCAAWWIGTDIASATFPQNGTAFCTGCNGQTQSQIIGEGSPDHMTAVTFLTDYNGDDAPMAVVYGGFNLVSAVAYTIALGGLAIGVFLAQFILIAMLCALPLLLLAMAISNKTEEVAKNALKVGVKAIVAKVVFLFILLLLVEFIFLVDRLINDNSSGLGTVLLTAAAPLLAFYALHTLLRQVGMQGMLSIRGSVATTAGFALGKHQRAPYAEGRNWAERQDSRFQQRLGQLHKGGVRPPDANRPGGTRTPESGTRKLSSLYPKKLRGGGATGTTASSTASTPLTGVTSSASPTGNSGAGKPKGGGAGATGPARAPNPFAVPGMPFPKPRDFAASARNMSAGMRQRLASFRSPEAKTARQASRTRLYHAGLGVLATSKGGEAIASGIAGTVAHAGHAKTWLGTRTARIAEARSRKSHANEIQNKARAMIDSGKRTLHAKHVEQRKARRAARIEGLKDPWRRFGEDATARGKFHADFARTRLSSRIAGQQQPERKTSWAAHVRNAHGPGIGEGHLLRTDRHVRIPSQPGRASGTTKQSGTHQHSSSEPKPQDSVGETTDSHAPSNTSAETAPEAPPPSTRTKRGGRSGGRDGSLRPSHPLKPLPEPKRNGRSGSDN
jgi:hypothetical protein